MEGEIAVIFWPWTCRSEQVTSRRSRDHHKLVVSYAFEHGVICMTAGTWGNVVRLLCPDDCQEQLDEGLDIISGLAQCGETMNNTLRSQMNSDRPPRGLSFILIRQRGRIIPAESPGGLRPRSPT